MNRIDQFIGTMLTTEDEAIDTTSDRSVPDAAPAEDRHRFPRTSATIFCKNCGLPIAKLLDPWGGEHGWHHPTVEREVNIDGADVMTHATFCPDDQGDAEPQDSPDSAAQSAEAQSAEGMTHAKPDSPTAQSVIPEFSSVPWELLSERDWDNEQEGK